MYFSGEDPELKAWERDFRGGTLLHYCQSPPKLIWEIKQFFNLHLYNYLRIIKNPVLRINHFSRYVNSNEKLCVSRENILSGLPLQVIMQL